MAGFRKTMAAMALFGALLVVFPPSVSPSVADRAHRGPPDRNRRGSGRESNERKDK